MMIVIAEESKNKRFIAVQQVVSKLEAGYLLPLPFQAPDEHSAVLHHPPHHPIAPVPCPPLL